jgi:hypothetical protein
LSDLGEDLFGILGYLSDRHRLLLSGDVASTRLAVEIAFGEKSLFGTGEAFPANISHLATGLEERIVMLHHAVALGAPDRWFIYGFRIDALNHGSFRSISVPGR